MEKVQEWITVEQRVRVKIREMFYPAKVPARQSLMQNKHHDSLVQDCIGLYFRKIGRAKVLIRSFVLTTAHRRPPPKDHEGKRLFS